MVCEYNSPIQPTQQQPNQQPNQHSNNNNQQQQPNHHGQCDRRTQSCIQSCTPNY